ncbi:DUF5606 domain-containing protein [Formosa sp. L2A11]|uniref:DUF5606 family protein n=1 Tax=Formosa sp. L2A11 TaxID=2686363 RepID=UPI00131E278F|nr:DUF5606 domain-containing protein [Formosa sp. L2A11]
MSLDKVLAISGKPGLYKLIMQTRNGFIAESLLDNKRLSVTMNHNVSVLSEIAIYTLTEEVPLKTILETIANKESNGPSSISHKDSKDKLEEYFFEILPEYDEDRVYPSDIKKVIQWYNLLQKNDLLDFTAESEEQSEEVNEEAVSEKE